MKRVLFFVVMVMSALPVAAQQSAASFPVGLPSGLSAELPEGVVALIPGSGTILMDTTAAQTRNQAARPTGTVSTRRPSMVGYIEDSTIGTGLRIRFDAANQITEPDRAEFFYAKCGCYTGVPTNSPNYDPNAPGDRGGLATDINAQQLFLQGEYGLMANRASLFVELPLRWLSPQQFFAGNFASSSGISDLRFGAKFGVMASDHGQATALLRIIVPTGNAGEGLGVDHTSIEPAIVVNHELNPKIGLEGEFGGVFPTGGSAGLPTAGPDKFSGSVLYYGIGPSFDVYANRGTRLSPVIELVGWRVLSGFQTGNPAVSSGPSTGFAKVPDVAANIINIKFGARLTMRETSSIYVGYGKHLTDAMWYDDIFRIEYRMAVKR